jgi:TfoX/Sxy family transcriptional regulator of competence genes
MAYDENFADRVRSLLAETQKNVEEKKMFGGLCFMVNDKMCVGVMLERLMVRIDPDLHDQLLEKEDCRPMDFSGKSMKGFVYVDIAVLQSRKQLAYWIKLALDYNPKAKASGKKSKK